jgi:hypothetical protein
MPRVLRLPKYAFFHRTPEPETKSAPPAPVVPAPDPLVVIGDIIQSLIDENAAILYAEVREKMVAAGFHKKVIGQIWNDRFFRSRAHLEPPKRKKQVVVEVSQ